MRKLIVSIAFILLPCLFLSCTDSKGGNVETSENSSNSSVDETPETTAEGKLNSDKTLPLLDTLSDYLTDEGYTDTKEETLIGIVSKYSYEGTSLPELFPGAVYEGTDNSGGMDGGDGSIRYSHRFFYPEDGNDICYNRFYTQVPLDDLTLPHGIDFEDKISDVLKKLGLEFNPDNFISDSEDNRMKATLLTSEDASLMFYNYHYSDLADYADKYSLQFTDIYYWERPDGVKISYTRELALFFDDSSKLYRVWMQISS